MRGLLCYQDPKRKSQYPEAQFANIIRRPGLDKFFAMLLQKFHVGIWSSTNRWYLLRLLRHILPDGVEKRLAFIFSQSDARDFDWAKICYKRDTTLFRKDLSRAVCVKDQFLFVDVNPVALRMTPKVFSYLPHPFVGDLCFPNKSKVIPNIATDLLPFIYPLHRFPSVPDYMRRAIIPGQSHYSNF